MIFLLEKGVGNAEIVISRLRLLLVNVMKGGEGVKSMNFGVA